MAQMYLVITIRKPVSDSDQGELIYELVKQKLSDRPDLQITGSVNNHYDMEPEPDPP